MSQIFSGSFKLVSPSDDHLAHRSTVVLKWNPQISEPIIGMPKKFKSRTSEVVEEHEG